MQANDECEARFRSPHISRNAWYRPFKETTYSVSFFMPSPYAAFRGANCAKHITLCSRIGRIRFVADSVKEGQLRCFLHHTKLTRAVCRTKKQRSPSKAVLKIANEKRTGLSSDEVEPDAKILSVDVSFKKVVQICRGPLLVDPSASVTLTPTLNSRHRPTHGAKPRHGTLEMQESRSDKGTPLCQSLKQNRGSGWARCWGKIGDGA